MHDDASVRNSPIIETKNFFKRSKDARHSAHVQPVTVHYPAKGLAHLFGF